MIRRIKHLLHHPLVNLAVGLLMIGAGAGEVLETLRDLESATLKADHGVVLLGLLTLARGLVEGLEGVERLDPAAPAG